MRHEAQCVGVGSSDGVPRKPEVGAGLARQPAKHVTDTDVGKEPDHRLGHRKRIVFAGDAMCSVLRDADAAAHDHAVDERNCRLGKAFALPVERVFLGERRFGFLGIGAAPSYHLAHIGTGREGALARRLQNDGIGVGIAGCRPQRFREARAHRTSQRVQSFWPIERGKHHRALLLDTQVLRGLVGHSIVLVVFAKHHVVRGDTRGLSGLCSHISCLYIF